MWLSSVPYKSNNKNYRKTLEIRGILRSSDLNACIANERNIRQNKNYTGFRTTSPL